MSEISHRKTDAAVPAADPAKISRWEGITIALLLLGYAGYYFCRSDLSVATPLLIRAFGDRGVTKETIGSFVSLGILFYAAGKFVNGTLADFLGGRRMFLLGMGGAVAATLLFTRAGVGGIGVLPIFTLAWTLNRALQSTGWVGMVKITSRWFSFSRYGTVMGIISLSFLFGDFFSRLFLGQLISWGVDWRGVFYAAAGVLGVLFLANLLLLKESPRTVGGPEPEVNPANLFGADGKNARPAGLGELLAPLLRSGLFWTVCALSLGFTLVRETFNTWIPEYLTEVVKMKPGDAAQASSLFPLFGGFSVLAVGFLSDRIGRTGRAAIIFCGLVLALPALLTLAYTRFGGPAAVPVFVLGAIAFVMLGPYSFLAGAISLDFGGKRGSATACGIIDGVGYVGGILAGEPFAAIVKHSGWSGAFLALTGVAALTGVMAAVYWVQQARHASATALAPEGTPA